MGTCVSKSITIFHGYLNVLYICIYERCSKTTLWKQDIEHQLKMPMENTSVFSFLSPESLQFPVGVTGPFPPTNSNGKPHLRIVIVSTAMHKAKNRPLGVYVLRSQRTSSYSCSLLSLAPYLVPLAQPSQSCTIKGQKGKSTKCQVFQQTSSAFEGLS